jgi:hypothetical protein
MTSDKQRMQHDTVLAQGAACFVWLALWMFLVYDNPEDHPWISQQERDYITTNRATLNKVRYRQP